VTAAVSRVVSPVVAASVCVLGLDLAILAHGLTQGWGTSALVAGHLCAVAPAAIWFVRSPSRSDPHALLLLISSLAFGPLGPTGVLFSLVLERHYARRATPVEQWHEMLFPPVGPDPQANLWRRVGQRASDRSQDRRVTPFLDVLAFGSVQQRQAAVAIIAQQFRPAFAPALKAALRDEHNVIRVQAATVIARLEQEFLERTFALEAAVARTPNDPDAVLALARHCDDQAFTGLLDSTREEGCRAQAVEGYASYLALRPDDAATELRLARLQLRRGVYGEAEPRLQRLADDGHASARLWLMEALYAQRRFSDLRGAATRGGAVADESLPFEALEAMELWAGDGVRV
jgi:hypothetical protein